MTLLDIFKSFKSSQTVQESEIPTEPQKRTKFDKKKEYWLDNVIHYERTKRDKRRVKFKIVNILDKGFHGYFNRTKCFASFKHMPWQYKDSKYWQHVLPYLQNKLWDGQIFDIIYKHQSLILDLKAHRLKVLKLSIGSSYKGIIINKLNNGFEVEFGYTTHWDHGSIIGFVHKGNFTKQDFENKNCGEIISSRYWGNQDNGQSIFGNDIRCTLRSKGIIERLKENEIKVSVRRDKDNHICYYVKDLFPATIKLDQLIKSRREYMKKALSCLEPGDVFHARVTSISNNQTLLHIECTRENEIKAFYSRKYNSIYSSAEIKDSIPIKQTQILKLLNKNVSVEVFKEERGNKYRVNGFYNAEIIIKNNEFRITENEKKQIESNFQDNEILKCKLVRIEKNKLFVQWNISKFDFTRFTNINPDKIMEKLKS